MKLLIVDDNINECECLRDMVDWNELGFDDVQFALNGLLGYEKAKEIIPTLIISDVSMPVLNGLEMAKCVLKDIPETKFIFISCFDDTEYITTAIDRNAYGYLLKPIDLNSLVETVKKVLKIEGIEKERKQAISILESKISEYIPAVKEQALKDIIFGVKVDDKKIKEAGIRIEGSCAVLTISICSDDDYLTTYSIKEEVERFFEEKYNVYAVIYGRNKTAVLFDLKKQCDTSSAIDEVICAIGDFCDFVEEEYIIKINVCIGGIALKDDDIKELFTRADIAINEANGFCSIRMAEEFMTPEAVINYNMAELKSNISSIITNGDLEALNKFIDKYYDERALNSSYVFNGFNFIVVALLQMVIIDENENFGNIFGSDYLIWNKLVEHKSIVDIRYWIYNIFKSVIEYLEQKNSKDAPYVEIVNNIKKYINEHYADIESIAQITKEVYISDSYANHLFKKYEGITIFDYLIKVRINEAKLLLKNKSIKIYEIAYTVGYKSSAYFSNVFKTYEGITPKKYRDNI